MPIPPGAERHRQLVDELSTDFELVARTIDLVSRLVERYDRQYLEDTINDAEDRITEISALLKDTAEMQLLTPDQISMLCLGHAQYQQVIAFCQLALAVQSGAINIADLRAQPNHQLLRDIYYTNILVKLAEPTGALGVSMASVTD